MSLTKVSYSMISGAPVNIVDYGVKCDGITDDTAAIQAAILSIGSSNVSLIIPGPTKFSATLTFNPNTQLVFENGGYFLGTVGTEVINVQRQPIAGPNLIFSNCKPTANTGMNCMPEWFGAKADNSTISTTGIQSAITFLENVGGIVQFASGTYVLDGPVTIGNNTTGGAGSKTVLSGVGANVTILKTTPADASAIQILGISANPCRSVVVKDLSVTKSVSPTGGIGIAAIQTRVLQIINVNVADYLYGVQLNNATNTNCTNVYVTISGTANTWRGFFLQGDASFGNASSYFNMCFVDGRNSTGTGGIGFYSTGPYGSDLVFFECETSFGSTGWYLDFTSSALNGNEDVQLIQCRADAYDSSGIFITGAGSSGSSDSMISIIGGWFNAKSTGAETNSIRLFTSRGVSISNVQFYNDTNYANGNHVKMTNCQNVIINSCLFTSMKYGVYADTCEYSVISSNRFFNQAGRTATGFVNMASCVRSMVNDNAFDGYATYGVYIDSSSIGCGVVGNTINGTNIVNRVVNAGTSPVGGSDGTTGLNSGA